MSGRYKKGCGYKLYLTIHIGPPSIFHMNWLKGIVSCEEGISKGYTQLKFAYLVSNTL